MFDKQGYPTDEYLALVREAKSLEGALELVDDAWKWGHRSGEVRPGIWTFSTGGWSGNEDLLEALYRNVYFLQNWDKVTLPGGLLCIATTDEAKTEMEKLKDIIRDWAWREENGSTHQGDEQ